jgi:hypothetical protein
MPTDDARLDRIESEFAMLDKALSGLTRQVIERHDVTRARRFELVDEDGRALLTIAPQDWSDNGAVIALFNAEGKELVSIAADDQTGRVSISRFDDEASTWCSIDALSGLYEAPAIFEEPLRRAG